MNSKEISVPNFPKELELNQSLYLTYNTDSIPVPLSTTQVFINEKKNSNPYLIRSSMYVIPGDNYMLNNICLPFGIIINPFNTKVCIPEIKNQLRCVECFSFANPYCKFESNSFTCNLCGYKNSVKEFLSPDLDNFRFATVEFVEDFNEKFENESIINQNFYRIERNKSALIIFAVELTIKSVNSGFFKKSLDAIRKNIENLRFFYKKVAFLIFGEMVKILYVKNSKNENKKSVKILNLFQNDVILSKEFVFEISDLEIILEKVEQLKPISNDVIINLTLNYISNLSQYFIGTKTFLFSQQKIPIGTDLGQNFIDNRNSLNVFQIQDGLFNPLEKLITETNGYLNDIESAENSISVILQQKPAFGVSIEVKTSDSIRKFTIFGNTIHDSFNTIFSQMDEKSTVSYTFFIDESMKESQNIYLQVSIIYYSHLGEKRTIILNQKFTSSYKYSNIYNNMSVDTTFSLILRSIAANEVKNTDEWKKKIINSLKIYRKKCSSDSKPTQLVLPDSIKSLPNLFQGMLKNKDFNGKINQYKIIRISNQPVDRNLRYFYPRLFTFSDFYLDRKISNCQSLTKRNLINGEIYILDNSETIYIYLTNGVDKELIDLLFKNFKLIKNENNENMILQNLIDKINEEYRDILNIKIIRQGNDVEVLGYLIEDELNGIVAYSEYLCDIHFAIRDVK